MGRKSFSEYVSPGHPDKVADFISEYLLDKYIALDPQVRYAVEVMVKGNDVVLGGEVTSQVHIPFAEIEQYVREAVRWLGYTEGYARKWGDENTINPKNLRIYTNISQQSSDISVGVDASGWGDQGIFFGFADYEGDDHLMPLCHSYSKSLCYKLYRKALDFGVGGLDIKTEIIMDDKKVEKIIAAVPCMDNAEYEKVLSEIKEWAKENTIDKKVEIILNGTGNYKMHGPIADCGITGRKLAVDFYSGDCCVGGGSPWTKDASKADLSLNLLARHIAKKLANNLHKTIKTEIACCIGKNVIDYQISEPCGTVIGSGTLTISPKELRELYELNTPIYSKICNFGLFGANQEDRVWENVDAKFPFDFACEITN